MTEWQIRVCEGLERSYNRKKTKEEWNRSLEWWSKRTELSTEALEKMLNQYWKDK